MIYRISDNFIRFICVAHFFAMFYNVGDIPQKGGSRFQGNWWELCIQAEPLYKSGGSVFSTCHNRYF